MNIQDEMQKIHHKFGVSEMANYKIEQFIENLIKEDRAKQLTLTDVSHQRELLKGFANYLQSDTGNLNYDFTELVSDYLDTL
jgi:hypothetical protein